MVQWSRVPLLNTCLSKSTTVISKRNMSLMVLIVVSFMVILPIASSVENSSAESQSDNTDVFFLDLPCDVNSTCEVSRPIHLVEYFGADWCEPCESLELFLDTLDFSKIALIQHHPSVLDNSYLNHSKKVFEQEYRLLFIPSLVVNSNGLLTGSTQAIELNQSLANINTNFSGISDISIENGLLFWNTTTNHNLTIWRLEETSHEYHNRSLPYLAVERITVTNQDKQHDISQLLNYSNGRLIFILQDNDQPIPLQSISTSPTGDKSLSEGEEETNSLFSHNGDYDLAVITFALLFLALLPALISFRNLQKQDSDEAE